MQKKIAPIHKLSSLTIFFPFCNDAGTVFSAIEQAFLYGNAVAKKLEVIAIHGGQSHDSTWQQLQLAKEMYPSLKILNHTHNNEGYAVIRHGFSAAKGDWVFYTDGDLQFKISEIERLVRAQHLTGADIVNGYRLNRSDPSIRVVVGAGYQHICRLLFLLPIRDIDCDFRLIRTKYIKNLRFSAEKSSILPEMIKKLEFKGAKFFEIPVSHVARVYGSSNYSAFALLQEKFVGDIKLWWSLRKQLWFEPMKKLKNVFPLLASVEL